jgi:hypothetical protein
MRTTTSTHTDTAAWIIGHDPLSIVELADPVIDSVGFDARSPYVETYWLAVLGPSAILALRRVADWLEDRPSGIEISLEDLALTLGLGQGTGRHAAIVRTLDRLTQFDMATIVGDRYAVRTSLPPLSARHLRRLPRYLADRHPDELTRLASAPTCTSAVTMLR